jgi:hypothetical protein
LDTVSAFEEKNLKTAKYANLKAAGYYGAGGFHSQKSSDEIL